MENKMLKLIKSRRCVRAYKEDAVPCELLDAVLEAGTYAPTGMGMQSPVIIAVCDKSLRERISKLNAKVMGASKDPYYGAPVIVLVLADKKIGTWVEDGSCVIENMMLEAHSLGLASCWIHREREIFDSAEGKEILSELNLSKDLRGVGSIALGYAKDEKLSEAAPRKNKYIVKV